ncbi:MAG: efflux transporter periplasmic adaptor subunit [Hydrogenophilales bacterium 16-64-46]|nr:MAG: efflux transporter periplasmic adaptor subunit [Hydrogenophilales bacterium 12-64-13]OYZ04166.1 MAG: efflux transporter periplasmic adaptor subunit [Hydrogenophilales bacterium 16-64-46]OZA36917.1 MAG: efflux transporter periplasmic adaptor subunit [Hydrogenophilales bacterium 17-64-34]HQS99962.1 efflux RND transporter periplasmic adaptor subunit [Thiobacillus sp.]
MTAPLPPSPPGARPLDTLIGDQARGRLARRWPVLLLASGVALALGVWMFGASGPAPGPAYRTEPASVGTLTVKVSATGNLQPTNTVDVGSELSGIVERVQVDDNDTVKKGQVLAQLDLSKLSDAVAKSQATLVAAQAQVLQAQATTVEARATLGRFREVSRLSGGKVPSRTEMDAAEANLKRAEANVASAEASVSQSRAALQSDQTNLGKASIRSPIDGVVLARQVEPGQTVAASFQAPVLFKLAEDLTQMELQVDVDEADVGQVKAGQPATFSVDAWPGRTYQATVTRVGFGAQENEGVVSYRTVLDVRNDDLSLRPGMTGTAEITALVRPDALLVPNAALRFSPAAPAAATKSSAPSLVGMMMPRPPSSPAKPAPAAGKGAQRVWVLENGQPVERVVTTGASNGRQTEILGGLKPGVAVIVEATDATP